MSIVNNNPFSAGTALYAASRAADCIQVLRQPAADGDVQKAELVAILKQYGEHSPQLTNADVATMRAAANELYVVFTSKDVAKTAQVLNTILAQHASTPQLTSHGGKHPWHIHVDGSEHAPWGQWFASSSALALAVLLAEKQRVPGGLCASAICGRPFIDSGKGGGRLYCSPRCATRQRVAAYRRKGTE